MSQAIAQRLYLCASLPCPMRNLVLLFLAGSPAASLEASSVVLPWVVDSMSVGTGINSATGEIRSPKCLLNPKLKEQNGTGNIIRFQFKGISSMDTMQDALDTSVGASYGGFGFHVSAQADCARSQSLSKYEAAYVLKVTVDKSTPMMLDPSTSWDESLNGRPDIDDLCGDSFIERAVTGGRLYAVFRVDKQTFDKHEGTKIDAEGGGWGAEMQAALDKSMSYQSQTSQVNIDVFQIGGNGAGWQRSKASMTGDELVEIAKGFISDADKLPFPYKAVLRPYGSYFPEYKPATVVDVRAAQKAMQLLLDKFTTVLIMLESVNFIESHQRQFEDYTHLKTSCLDPLNTNATEAMNQIREAYDTLNTDYSAKMPVINLPDATCLPWERLQGYHRPPCCAGEHTPQFETNGVTHSICGEGTYCESDFDCNFAGGWHPTCTGNFTNVCVPTCRAQSDCGDPHAICALEWHDSHGRLGMCAYPGASSMYPPDFHGPPCNDNLKKGPSNMSSALFV